MLTGKGSSVATLVVGALVMWAVVAAIKNQQPTATNPLVSTG
ncbi:hypothetical protein [Trinickia acidisoli]|nr:hypothetical protein [Trinickia acidisoli]